MSVSRSGAVAGLALVAAFGCASAAPTPSPEALRQEVFETERAFAKTMADRDHAAFASFLAPETVFFAGEKPLRGSGTVATYWKSYYEGPAAPFSWRGALLLGAGAGRGSPVRDTRPEHRPRARPGWKAHRHVHLDLAARGIGEVADRLRQGMPRLPERSVKGAERLAALAFLLAGPLAAQPDGDVVGRVLEGAERQVGVTVVYDGSYRRLDYPGGDVPPERGVCTDVVVRAYRNAGIDLQVLVHEDLRRAFAAYPQLWGTRRPSPGSRSRSRFSRPGHSP